MFKFFVYGIMFVLFLTVFIVSVTLLLKAFLFLAGTIKKVGAKHGKKNI